MDKFFKKFDITYVKVAEDDGVVGKILIPVKAAKLIAAIILVLIIATSALYVNLRYITAQNDVNMQELTQLRDINETQRLQIDTLKVNLNDVNSKVKKLEETDKKIQNLLN